MKIRYSVKIVKVCAKNKLQFIELIFLMIGSVVGVGLISGAEIYEVFARFKANSIFGLIVFFCLIFLLVHRMIISKINSVNLYKIDKNASKNTNTAKSKIKENLLFVNMLLVASAMISGLKTLINQLGINHKTIVFCAALMFVFYFLLRGLDTFSKINTFMMLFIVFVLLFLLVDVCNVSI